MEGLAIMEGLAEAAYGLLSHSQAERFQTRIDVRFRCRLVRNRFRPTAGRLGAYEVISRRTICTVKRFRQLL